MTLIDQVQARLDGGIAHLTGRVETAAAFAALTATGELPAVTPAAFVIPLGFDARPRASATFHVQQSVATIGVVLVASYPGDGLGSAALPEVDGIAREIVALIAGWQPEGAIDCFDVTRGRLVDIRAGHVFYQIDFAIQETIRA